MEGIIFDIKKYAVHDGPGIRTTVFFKGCPLNCLWCHNPESHVPDPEILRVRRKVAMNEFRECDELIGKRISVHDLVAEIEKDLLFYEESGGGVTFSGGEPFLQTEFLLSTLRECKERNISTVIDTSGFTEFENIKKVLSVTDLFLYDLKIIDDGEHWKYTGVSNQLILENLIKLSKLTKNYRVRIPLIPLITDRPENLSQIVKFLQKLNTLPEIDVLPYNEICAGKYERFNRKYELGEMVTQSEEKLSEIVCYLEKNGFKVKVKG